MENKYDIKMDLSDLPTRYNGIDWKGSVGKYVSYEMESIKGNILIKEIDEKDAGRIIIEENGKEASIKKSSLRKGNIKKFIGCSLLKQMYNIGDVIESRHTGHKFTIINYEIQTNDDRTQIVYTCKCEHCGSIFQRPQTYLKNGCMFCHKNDTNIPNTAPWMIPYFQGGYDEAKLYQRYSQDEIIPKCPICGKIQDKPIKIADLYKHGLITCDCSTTIPFTEQLVMSILDQLNISYIHQASCKSLGFDDSFKKYDFYLPDHSIIIETHGAQHYNDISCWRKYKDQSKNDTYKKKIAISHGIKHYIIIDCRKSNLKWIKKSILNSDLPLLLNFNENDVDWNKCNEYKLTGNVKEICEDYKNNYLTLDELVKKYNLSRSTISIYLTRGAKEGWCIHDKLNNTKRRPLEVIKDGHHIGYFRTMGDAADYLSNDETKFWYKNISKVIDTNEKYKGYNFRHVESIPLRWDILQGKIS